MMTFPSHKSISLSFSLSLFYQVDSTCDLLIAAVNQRQQQLRETIASEAERLQLSYRQAALAIRQPKEAALADRKEAARLAQQAGDEEVLEKAPGTADKLKVVIG